MIIEVIELMFLGVNMFLALLRGPKTYLLPKTSTLLLYGFKKLYSSQIMTTRQKYLKFHSMWYLKTKQSVGIQ